MVDIAPTDDAVPGLRATNARARRAETSLSHPLSDSVA